MRVRIPATVSLAVILMAAHSNPCAAQDSRAAIIGAQQEEKAKTATPYTPGGAERVLVAVEREFLQDPNGLYPYFGSVYSGGGFTLGAGYRRFYGDRTHADLKGLYSLKNYKLFELSTDSWGHADGRLDLHARAGWRDATQVAFHGIGMDSPEDRSNFRMKQAYVGGDAEVRPVPWTVFRAGMSYEDFSLESGTGSNPVDRGSALPCLSARTRREPGVSPSVGFRWHRYASGPRLRAARRALRSHVPQLRRQ